MAEHQRTGAPYTPAHLAFLNRAVRLSSRGCGTLTASDGWYTDLFLEEERAVALRALVADVHTQPSDERGATVGRVLHAGTGRPRMMVVAVENCTGPRVYVGFVSSYFEHISTDFQRLDDDAWRLPLWRAHPADVPWMAPLITRDAVQAPSP